MRVRPKQGTAPSRQAIYLPALKTLAALACAITLTFPALAQEQRTSLTVLDAVTEAMRHNPAVQISRAELTLAGGERLQAQGVFDPVVSVAVSLQRLQQELSDTRKQQLIDQRTEIQTTIDSVRSRRDDAQAELDAVIAAEADPANIQLPNPDAQAQLDLYNALIEGAPSPAIRAQLEQLRAAQLAARRVGLEERIAEFNQTDAEESERLRLLGEAPEVELQHDVSIGANYRQAYRNGWVVNGFADLTIAGGNYKDKPRLAAFGGQGLVDLYRSRIGVRLLTPFARGRTTDAAAEGAAIDREHAAAALLAHRLRTTLRGVVGAYWELAAAQAVRDVLAESVQRQQRLAELSEALIVADQLPPSDRARLRARDADAAAQLAQAEQSLASAQLALSRAIGAPLDAVHALPVAADALPDLEPLPELAGDVRDRAIAASLARRQDYLAARHSAAGRALLAQAAREDMQPVHDLETEVSMSGVDEGSSIDQQLRGSLGGSWTGPSVKLTYAYERPWRNDTQRGAWQQQQAQADIAQVEADALRNDVGRQLLSTFDTLRAAQREVQLQREAVEAYQAAVGAERERLQLGSATLIDLIQTEERLTSSLLGAVGAQVRAAVLLLDLRLQGGLLAPAEDDEFVLDQRDLVRLELDELLAEH